MNNYPHLPTAAELEDAADTAFEADDYDAEYDALEALDALGELEAYAAGHAAEEQAALRSGAVSAGTLDALMQPSTEDMVLFRGVNEDCPYAEAEAVERGYMSCTEQEDGGMYAYHLALLVPAGTPMVDARDAGHGYEGHIVLGRGLTVQLPDANGLRRVV